jgi:hypothetical protein
MDDQHRHRTLVESAQYSEQFDAIMEKYASGVIRSVLAGLLWGISTNPEAYERTTWNFRIAKSRSLGGTIPTFNIFFQIENEGAEDERVLLRWIEEATLIEETPNYLM